MANKKKRRINGDLSEFILIILQKDGPQTLEQLQEKTAFLTSEFDSHRQEMRRARGKDMKGVYATCEDMVDKNWIKLAQNVKYELTPQGEVKAQETIEAIEQGAKRVETQFLSPSATARNTTVGYVVIAALKMVAGLLSGSVGLIADGADTAVDTAASAIVWAGIRFKKETIGTITTIVLMFITATLLFFDSARSVIKNITGTFTPMTMPIVVIAVELIAVFSMFMISFYQRYVGKRSQSLALISQSIDSKNSIYASAAVIIGAVFSIFGIHWVDAIVGAFIAVRICLDGVSLTREIAKTMKGQQPELTKFKVPFEERIRQHREDNFRNWIMYSIHNGKLRTKEEITASLEITFHPSYIPPVFTEVIGGRNMNFQEKLADIVRPLLDEGYLVEIENCYELTNKGKNHIKETIEVMRYKQTELKEKRD